MRVMFSRRWLGAFAVALAFAVACVFLGRWQWHRHEAKVARADRINSHYRAAPVPLASALGGTGVSLPVREEWTRVTATGRYAANALQLVRNRPNDGVYGYEVVVPLTLPDGTAVLVDRGWVQNADRAAERPEVPATPTGRITVTGWLRVGEPSLGRQMPAGQLASINLPEARTATGANLYGTYLIMDRESGSPGQRIVRPVPPGAAGHRPRPAPGLRRAVVARRPGGVRARLRGGPPRVAGGTAGGRRRRRPPAGARPRPQGPHLGRGGRLGR